MTDRLGNPLIGPPYFGSVVAVSTVPITLYGEQLISGVAVKHGDRILVAGQGGNTSTAHSGNAIYICQTGTWERARDFSSSRHVKRWMNVFVASAATDEDSEWTIDFSGDFVAGTTLVSFALKSLLSASYQDPVLSNPAEPDGKVAAIGLPALAKFEIKFEEQYTPAIGYNQTLADVNLNTLRLMAALEDASAVMRPLKMPKGVLEIGYAPITFDNVEINGNGGTLRHGLSTATTMLYIHGADASNRIQNFRMYDITIDANAQAKTGNFYALSASFHSDMFMEDVTVLDFWSNAWIISDPYNATVPWPVMTSNDLILKNIRALRSQDNIDHIALYPAMMQGDQAVVTGVYNARMDDVYAYYSGRSGLSWGLCDGGYLRGFRSQLCWTSIYTETLSNAGISGFDIRDHMHFDGVEGAADTQGIWVADGDQSLPGTGYATAKTLQINDGRIAGISRSGGSGGFHGIRVSGRNGTDRAQAITLSNITGNGLRGGAASGLLTFEGELTGCTATNINAHDCDVGYRADRSYTAPGGSAANVQTDTWVNGLHCSNVTAAVSANNAGGTHTRSGVRNSTFGGGTTAFTGTLTNHSTNTA